MRARIGKRWMLVGISAVTLVFGGACIQLAPLALDRFRPAPLLEQAQTAVQGAAQTAVQGAAQTAVQGAIPTGRRGDVVRRGPVTESVVLSGRVIGEEEVPLTLPKAERVETLNIRVGDVVQGGQLLLQTESREVANNLAAARTQLQNDQYRLEQLLSQAQVQAQTRQRLDAQRLEEAQRSKVAAIASAEAQVRAAQLEVERVEAGASIAERKQAQDAVNSARATLAKAQSDLAKLQQGNPNDVLAAERELTNAQIVLAKAQADLEKLLAGPNPLDVRAAERDLERARSALRVAQAVPEDAAPVSASSGTSRPAATAATGSSTPPVPTSISPAAATATAVSRQAAIANAQLAVVEAEDKLARLRQGPPRVDVEAARQNVRAAQFGVDMATNRLEQIRQGPDRAALDVALATVDSAQLNLDTALARRAEVESRPTPAELAHAVSKLEQAQVGLDNARAAGDPVLDDAGSAALEIASARRAIDLDRQRIAELEQTLASTRLTAPVAGTVTLLAARVGEPVDPTNPVVVITRPGELFVRVTLTGEDVNRIQIGQKAAVHSDALPRGAKPLNARVTSIAGTGPIRTALIGVDWGDSPIALGKPADATITIREKQNVLIVPESAIRSAGDRKFVDALEGTTRRVIDVQVGIVSGGFVEILGGLREGQIVLTGG